MTDSCEKKTLWTIDDTQMPDKPKFETIHDRQLPDKPKRETTAQLPDKHTREATEDKQFSDRQKMKPLMTLLPNKDARDAFAMKHLRYTFPLQHAIDHQ